MGHQTGVCHLVLGLKDDAWICVHTLQGAARDVLKEAERVAKSLDTVWSYGSHVQEDAREDQIVIKGERPGDEVSLRMGRRRNHSWQDAFRTLDRTAGCERALTSIFSAGLCADLALQRGRNQFSRTPATVAIIADQGTEPNDTEWGVGKIDDFLSGYAQELAEKGSLRRISARPAYAASFWISMAEKLWDPEVRKRIARGQIDKTTIVLLSRLAGAWLDIQGEMTIRVSGTTFVLAGDGCRRAWRQLMEWEGGGIKKGELRYLSGYKKQIPHMEGKILRGEMNAVRSKAKRTRTKVNDETVKGAVALVSRQLLEEARIYGACAPIGSFRMVLPRGMALRELGAHSLRVCLLPSEGMWIALEREDTPGVSFLWTVREPHLQRWILDHRLMPVIHLTCAALWRDLRVGGKEVMIDDAGGEAKPEELTDGKGRVKFKGRIKWGNEGDLETIMREATAVRWHVRKLPHGKEASRRVRALARKLDIDLKRGTTIVRSHRRGEPDQHAQNVPVRAQGLAQLILTERYCTKRTKGGDHRNQGSHCVARTGKKVDNSKIREDR